LGISRTSDTRNWHLGGDDDQIDRKKFKSSSTVMSIVTILIINSIFSSTTEESSVRADDDKKVVNDSSSTLTPIIISNGQILSRALVLNHSLLHNAKQAVQSDSTNGSILQASIEDLLLQANSFLSLRPKSIIEKDEIPPSGDKRHFLSLAPYRWPDSSKPNGLPYINHDGRVNPEVYSIPDKWNMDDMIYRVKILSLAYYFTDNPSYASKAAELLRVWFLNNSTHMHPNLQYAEVVRGENNNSGTMRGILHGKNLPDVIEAIRLIQNSPSWSKQDQQGMELWFSKYLDWLLNSKLGTEEGRQTNNHGTWYAVQVSAISLFFNKTHLAKSILQDVRDEFIARQIEPDGSQHYEIRRRNSLDYSIFNLLGLFKLASIGERLGIDLWNYKTSEGEELQQALDYLLPSILNKETASFAD
jgi:hypothetical protein